MDKQQLEHILEQHKVWLGGKRGVRAHLSGADLSWAHLSGANLRGADLLYHGIVPPEGEFIAYKATTAGVCRVLIPAHAERVSSLVGRKCRASSVIPLDECGGTSPTATTKLRYVQGEEVFADSFNNDIRVECTHGIHFFITREEAEEWLK